MTKRVVFTTDYIYNDWFEYEREDIAERNNLEIDEVPDQWVYDSIFDYIQEDMNQLKEELDENAPNGLLLTGTLGLWHGNPKISPVYIEDSQDLFNHVYTMSIEDIEFYYNDENELEITAYHHDGRNHFTIRALSEHQHDFLKYQLPYWLEDDPAILSAAYKAAKRVSVYGN